MKYFRGCIFCLSGLGIIALVIFLPSTAIQVAAAIGGPLMVLMGVLLNIVGVIEMSFSEENSTKIISENLSVNTTNSPYRSAAKVLKAPTSKPDHPLQEVMDRLEKAEWSMSLTFAEKMRQKADAVHKVNFEEQIYEDYQIPIENAAEEGYYKIKFHRPASHFLEKIQERLTELGLKIKVDENHMHVSWDKP